MVSEELSGSSAVHQVPKTHLNTLYETRGTTKLIAVHHLLILMYAAAARILVYVSAGLLVTSCESSYTVSDLHRHCVPTRPRS